MGVGWGWGLVGLLGKARNRNGGPARGGVFGLGGGVFALGGGGGGSGRLVDPQTTRHPQTKHAIPPNQTLPCLIGGGGRVWFGGL